MNFLGYDRERRDRRNRKPEEDDKVFVITLHPLIEFCH